MKDVKFDKNSSTFLCKSEKGLRIEEEYTFHYNHSCTHLWKDLNENDFQVELLINPYLNRESHTFAISDCSKSCNNRLGYIFPVTVLDSIEDFSDVGRNIENYFFVAFKVLLQRINSIKSTSEFSENFEDNVIVAIFNRKDNPNRNYLDECMHSLRLSGYSYFHDNNNCQRVEHYTETVFHDGKDSEIKVKLEVPFLYHEEAIDNLLKEYPKTNNTTHRFVLLYQVIEHLMDKEATKQVNLFIKQYQLGQISNNDMSTNLRNFTSEKTKINSIFSSCNISQSDFIEFKQSYGQLNCLTGYNPNTSALGEIFYSFRNQITHSYRNLHKHIKELSMVVQAAEKLILTIISKYPDDTQVNFGN